MSGFAKLKFDVILLPSLTLVLALGFLAGNYYKDEVVQQSIFADSREEPISKPRPAVRRFHSITPMGDRDGFLVFSGEGYEEDDFVRIYNEDGSLWYEFTYYYDDSDGDFDYQDERFTPYGFHPDYFILEFSLVGEQEDRYEVVVNENSGLTKFVSKRDRFFTRKTWEEYVLGMFSVDFSADLNPPLGSPDGEVLGLGDSVNEADYFHPIEIQGDWLKVRWNVGGPESGVEHSGWIRWKDGDYVVIDLFSLC